MTTKNFLKFIVVPIVGTILIFGAAILILWQFEFFATAPPAQISACNPKGTTVVKIVSNERQEVQQTDGTVCKVELETFQFALLSMQVERLRTNTAIRFSYDKGYVWIQTVPR